MKFTIGRKLTIGFSILIVFFLVSISVSFLTLRQSQNVNDLNSTVYVPSMRLLMEFNNLVVESEKLIGSWIFIQSLDDTRDKNRLRELISNDYPRLKTQLENISVNWNEEEQQDLQELFGKVDRLFREHQYVMNELRDFGSYDDPMVLFEIRPMMEPGGSLVVLTTNIVEILEKHIELQQDNVEEGQVRLYAALDGFRRFSITAGIIAIVGGLLIASIFIRIITRPVVSLRNILNMMGQGKLPDNKISTGEDEIGEMGNALNFLIDGLKEKAEFSAEIGKGNFESEFKPLSEEDILGLSLIDMRESLKKAKLEEDKRKIEDSKRNWSTQGVAQFAELLRQNNDNMQELSFNIIKNLVKYLEANQGGVFILNDDHNEEKFVELSACYAYERRKFLQKKIVIGEGLVGTCLQEGETIFLTEVPDSYVSITSGLGDSNPRCILIVPLKLNDEIFGIIEIASFKVLEPYQIEFVEKVGESIASTISSVKINIRTTELLHQSQEQSEEMRAQEEEMRQNMEEMHATQEEMERKEIENQGFFDAFNATIPFAEISVDGKFKTCNDLFCSVTGYSTVELEKENLMKIFDSKHLEKNGTNIIDMLKSGESISGNFKLHKNNGESLHAKGSFKPILNKYGSPIKIVFILQEMIASVN
jgi:PAS domain S-box-containing protein